MAVELRTLPAAVLEALASRRYGCYWKCLVEDAEGALLDLTDEFGVDWHAGHTILRDIDQLADTLSLRLRRDFGIPVQNLSLAPLMEGSLLNRDAYDDYAPRVDVARRIKLYVAIMPAGELPGVNYYDDDWQLIFEGWLDAWDSASQPMELSARDLMAELIDAKTDADFKFDDPDGLPIEELAQQFIDQFMDYDGPQIYVPVSPGVTRVRWEVSAGSSIGESVAALAETIGWSIRARWDDATSAYRITLFFLDPSEYETPAHTFVAGTYLGIRRFSVDRRDIVNHIGGGWTDRTTGNVHAVTPVSDPDSIAAYGLRRGVIIEGMDSPIDSDAEWTALAEAALAALKDPIADLEAERLLFPFVEPGMVLGFAADNRNTDVPIITAVKAVRDEVGPNRERTYITGRTRPAAAYLRYRTRAQGRGTGTGGQGEPPDPNQATITSLTIQEVNTTEGKFTQTTVVLGQYAARWTLYERDGAWPTSDGLEDGPLDRLYIVGDFSRADPQPGQRTARGGMTRYAIGLARNSAEKIGDRVSASVAVGSGGVGTEGPALEAVGVEPMVDRVRTRWTPNATILADLGRYVVDVYRDSLIIALSVAAEDGEADDTDAVPCGGASNCQYFEFVWRFRLRDTSSVHPTVEYTAPYGQLWQAFTL